MQRIIQSMAAGLAATDLSESCRLFHGRGQCYDGLGYINVDWFQPVVLITLYQQPDQAEWSEFMQSLQQFSKVVDCALVQRRYIRGGPIETLWGELVDRPLAEEQGLVYALSFGGKQNFGFFLDMAPGRAWLRHRSKGKKILNLFSYTCSFSVAAIAGGARGVVNVDMSRAALDVGRDNHRLNNQSDALKRDVVFFAHDLFRSWKKVISRGPYDIVVIDPPSRQKGSFIADKDYERVLRRLPALLPGGGDILACLNAPELDESFLVELFAKACSEAEYIERLNNREDFPESDPRRSLKMLHYRL